MKKIKLLTLLIILSLLLTGCPEKRQLENLGIINARGIDVDEENQIKANFVMFQFEAQSQNITKIVSGKGNTTTGAVNNANYEANFLLELGNIQLDLYGLEAAKKGVAPYLDSLNRNPNIPDTMYLALSETTAEEIIKVQEQGITINIGQYLHDVIEESSPTERHFPKMSLQRFMRYYNDVGYDPFLPIFEIVDGVPKITSIGFFQDDKYVGQLSIKNRELININFKNLKQEWLEVSIPSEPFKSDLNNHSIKNDETIHMTISVLKSKSKINLLNTDSLEFKHSLKLEANLIDFSIFEKLDLDEPKIKKKLEKEIEKELKSRYEKLLGDLQSLNSDPLGYGEVYRQNDRNKKLTSKEWRKLFPEINVNYHIDVDLIHHGEST